MNIIKNKRVAVFGLGVSGLEAVKLLSHLGAHIMAINTGDPKEWSKAPGLLDSLLLKDCFDESDPHLNEALRDVELLILSPGIPRSHTVVEGLLARNIPVWGEIELAYRVLSDHQLMSPIVGITGTNGKTTTVTFLGEMLEKCKRSVFVGGNIGVPFSLYVLNLLTKKIPSAVDLIVLELSSFQLESIEEFKVDIALMLNLFQNHGERYSQIEDYAKSKMLIVNKFNSQSVLIISDQSALIQEWAQSLDCNKIVISNTHPDIKFDLSRFKLPGIHNRINLAFILKVAELVGLEEAGILESINSFSGVAHRIEAVSTNSTFRVFNDAKSTNWDATLTAVHAMEEYKSDLYLILGGQKRGHGDSVKPYFKFLESHVSYFYLIGEMAQEIESEFVELGLSKERFVNSKSLELAVLDMQERSLKDKASKVLLFSPAFPSFDQFRNYAHRGECFKSTLLAHSGRSGM